MRRLKIRPVGGPGIYLPLPGESGNPTGKNIPPDIRYKYNCKPGQNRNPSGSLGYKGLGLKKMNERKGRTPEALRQALEHRELTEICRMAARDAIEKLTEIMKSETSADTAKISAINILMERAYGKATQTNVNTQVNADGKPTEIDDRELTERINSAIKRVEAVTARTVEQAGSTDEPADLRKLH